MPPIFKNHSSLEGAPPLVELPNQYQPIHYNPLRTWVWSLGLSNLTALPPRLDALPTIAGRASANDCPFRPSRCLRCRCMVQRTASILITGNQSTLNPSSGPDWACTFGYLKCRGYATWTGHPSRALLLLHREAQTLHNFPLMWPTNSCCCVQNAAVGG